MIERINKIFPGFIYTNWFKNKQSRFCLEKMTGLRTVRNFKRKAGCN
jgi:hypothetical protein